jgi:Methyltransferase domain
MVSGERADAPGRADRLCRHIRGRHRTCGLNLSDLEQRFDRNMAGHAPKVTKAKGPSRLVLRDLPLASFDVAYVDGSHQAADVLLDAVLVWDLVKTDGLVMFDDYGGGAKGLTEALDAFLRCMSGRYRLVHKAYQLVLTKTEEESRSSFPLKVR